MNAIPTYKLRNGIEMPSIGLGTYGLNQTTMKSSIKASYEAGASLIDTASAYDNEVNIGNAIESLSKQGVLRREDLIIQTKVGDKLYPDGTPRGYYFYNSSSCPNHDVRSEVMEQVESSLKLLKTDYLDVLLIHWPYNDVLCEIWENLERLYDEKIVRAIGVSNFKVRHLEKLMSKANIVPMIDQLCISPINSLKEEYAFAKEHGIQIEAYSPLNTIKNRRVQENHKQFYDLSEKYNKSISQVLLRWYYQKGILTIPKSSNAERVKMNSNIFDFELTTSDMEYIDSMNYGYQYLVESKFCPGY